jgi:hypothetical protein
MVQVEYIATNLSYVFLDEEEKVAIIAVLFYLILLCILYILRVEIIESPRMSRKGSEQYLM